MGARIFVVLQWGENLYTVRQNIYHVYSLRRGGDTMRTFTILAFVLALAACAAGADSEIPPFHSQHDFLLASPGGLGYGLYGYTNPALLKYVERPDILFTWSDASGDFSDFDRWGLFAGTGTLGFGVIRQDDDDLGAVNDYRVSVAFGGRAESFGIGYGWSTGDTGCYNRGNVITAGWLARPMRQLSMGLSGTFATAGSAKEGVADLAVRPLGNELLTVFGDYAIQDGEKLNDGTWSTGAALELIPGVRLTGRYFDTHGFTAGLSFSLGRIGLISQGHFDDEQEHSYTTYGVRLGSMDRSFVHDQMNRDKNYMKLNLFGPVKYQRFQLFDKSKTLMGLLEAIDAAKDDDAIAGIAINTSGMRINWEHSWEIREKLREFRAAGKHVVVYIDEADLPRYHFASIADRIVLDPIGEINLLGFRAGRYYIKGTLEKLGLGFDEWRFFKYKSAYESFSRDSMSEGDKEQIEKIIDGFYDLARTEICEARGIDPAEFDRLIDEEYFFLPNEAIEAGLVDTVGRWDEVEKMVEALEDGKKGMVGSGTLARFQLPKDNYWGDKPRIAVIYALGECAMDSGIKARSLSKVIEGAGNNKAIEAIVFRVDSPGGSALASDVVAEALKKCKEKKPVIVSQGWVAGSGGYWISMYGDTIVAAPNSITGSIGVIGGWIYNKGFKEKIGMSTDMVKAGEHADLGFGVSLPLIGTIPDRNLTEAERAKIERSIKDMYREFVEKVAAGRGMEYDDIHEVGQGRVWTGRDGLDIGLVDELGGIETAISIAKARAGIAEDEEVDIVQMPKPPLFNPEMFMPKLIGMEYKQNPMVENLKFRIKHNGKPMPMLPLDQFEYIMGSADEDL
jgi:protease-4